MASEELRKFLGEELQNRQHETLGVLDALRRTRRTRGGTGEPLKIPGHLNEVKQTIILTDALSVKAITRDE